MRLLLAVVALAALGISSAKAALVAAFIPNFSSDADASLFIYGAAGTNGTVSNNSGFNSNFSIGPSGIFTLNLSFDDSRNPLLISADNPIGGLALHAETFFGGEISGDATSLIDVAGLGTEYYAVAFNSEAGGGSAFFVTAVEDGTEVVITPSVDLTAGPAGVPITVTLSAGESVRFSSFSGGPDVTGTRIVGNKDIAVFAGVPCALVPAGVSGDCSHLVSQNFSVDNYGDRFIIAENPGGGTDSDLVRVLAAEDDTEVFVNGVSQGTIDAGGFLTIDRIGNAVITSSNPVTVGQYIRGSGTRDDASPAFAIVPAENQWLRNYVFATPVGPEALPENFLNIAILTSEADSLRLNGFSFDTSSFSVIGDYSVGNVAIPAGFGSIEAAVPFLAMIAGFGAFESYFSFIATAFSPGASAPPDPDPIPLPAALPLFLAGLAGMRFASRRRKV